MPVLPRHRRDEIRRAELLRPMLMKAQGERCYLCGSRLGAKKLPTMEHVEPRAAGGRDRRNLLLAHGRCNHAKADRAPYPCELIYLDSIYTMLGMPG